ncbi:chorismate-binding protein [Enteractinococcus coprophilus]|uniref:Para-aminobenzoate synthetase n=1 Tax=Enteractinococcus coprophilus TaxID=1027633 RepID=A0A543AFX3_9MICC|nr:chorismate-binding protein [Enteractinococcus coprophilus]TQL71426.1 para-aminobenzoate synthetase [Enteractinococcus coprophilus]
MILVVDTGGFTTNILAHQLGAVHIVPAAELVALNLTDYTHVVISHGTETPDLSAILEHPALPVLAIGSGYQHLAAAYGHDTVAPPQPVYGDAVTHRHHAAGILTNVESPVELISYHAWRVTGMAPTIFDVQAVDDADAALVYRVKETNHWGMHCDPAALQSTTGPQILENFLALAPVTSTLVPSQAASAPAARRLPVFTRTVLGQLDTAATFRTLQHGTPAAFWLDSAAAHLGQGETTIMGTNVGELAQTIRWDVATNLLDIDHAGEHTTTTQSVFDYLQHHAWQPEQPLDLEGFTGGWVGYLGYEAQQSSLAGHTNTQQATTPDAYWIRPQAFIRYDHPTQVTTLVAYADVDLLETLHATLVFGSGEQPSPQRPGKVAGHWRLTAEEYQHRATSIQSMLHRGEAAGICLTDTYCLDDYDGDTLDLYNRLRTKNSAPYAGYLRFNTFGDELEVLCASPEKFLKVDGNGLVESKPIKGTVARSNDSDLDAQLAQQMANDPKIQSENLMITDLLRDDLAKITEPGSVRVPNLMAVESFATVHQLVTTVTGHLQPNTPVAEVVKAVFPGGSMTGAPKLFSVQALETLEAGPRGIYSGAMGWLGDDNTAELNVVIRSMVIDSGHLSIGAGGAVVVGSDPVAEELEKHLKAQALLDSIAEQS